MSISESYNAWAAIYDTNDNKTRDMDAVATRAMLAAYSFNTVLEMGCGTGKNTEWFAQKAQQVIGLDFSEKMLEKAKQKTQANNVRFQQADMTKPWKLERELADLVSFNLVLEHIEDLDFVFAQAYNSLQDQGKLFLCELHPFKQYLGGKARFEQEGKVEVLEVFRHHLTDYIDAAQTKGFRLLTIKEWFDQQQPNEVPRLLSIVFEK